VQDLQVGELLVGWKIETLLFGMKKLRRTLGIIRMLDWYQRQVYLKLMIRRALGQRRDALPSPRGAVRKVLFVCHGNIMRSALAEAYFRKLASESGRGEEFETFSAGVFAKPGRAGDSRAREVAQSMGVSLEAHAARRLSPEDVARADIVCIMDSMNETVCLSRYPHAEKKILMLGAFGREGGEPLEIADPYTGDIEAVRVCFQRVERSVRSLWKELSER
jgi:protein-tyrosine-phosphatase